MLIFIDVYKKRQAPYSMCLPLSITL